MNSKPHRDEWLPPEPPEEDIRLLAYELWLNNGQVHGRDLEHWFTARQLLLHEVKEHHDHGAGTPWLPPEKGFARVRPNPAFLNSFRPDRRVQVAASGTGQRVRARHQPHAHALPVAQKTS